VRIPPLLSILQANFNFYIQFLNCRDIIDSYISEIKKTTDTSSPFYSETGCKHQKIFSHPFSYLNTKAFNFTLVTKSCSDTNLHVTLLDLFAAGSDTTTKVLTWTVLYLTAHEDMQEKLYQEIVKAAGTDKSPQLADRKKYDIANIQIYYD